MADTATPIKRLNPGIMSEQVAVRVRNIGDSRLKLEYANQTWLVEPGEDAIAPYLAACYWFGDPRAVNIGDSNRNRSTQYRTLEVDRLSVLYGVYSDAFTADDDDTWTVEQKVDDYRKLEPRPYVNRRHPNLPQVEVYDLTTSERILTVIDDPAGDLNAEHSNSSLESQALKDQMLAMQAQMSAMAAQLAQRDPDAAREVLAAAPTPDSLDVVSTDDITSRLEGEGDEIEEPTPTERASTDTGSPTPRSKTRR